VIVRVLDIAPSALLVGVLCASPPAMSEVACGNFQPGTMSTAKIRTDFDGAILHLRLDGKPSGTGYLIDTDRGYILTASHVVVYAGAKGKITAESRRTFGKSLQATIDWSLPGHDVALLKLVDPTQMKGVQAIDVSLQIPNEDTSLYATGYPRFGDEPGNVLHAQDVRVIASPDVKLQVRQAGAEGGASGGPLLDPSGAAVGTAIQSIGVGESIARYVPMIAITELLDRIPMSEAMIAMDKEVRAGVMPPAVLRDKMYRRIGNPTNLDMYAWGRRILKNENDYAAIAALVRCPISHALIDRGLSDIVVSMTRYANSPLKAIANLNVAQREARLGTNYSAIRFARAAEAEFAASNDEKGLASARLTYARSQLALGLAREAASTMVRVNPNVQKLPVNDKGFAYATSARIDEKTGRLVEALPNYTLASKAFYDTGMYSQAGEMSASRAEINLRTGKYHIAQADFEEAYKFYKRGNDSDGQSESLYKLAIAKQASGETAGFLATLQQYLIAFPMGKYSVEASRALAAEKSAP